MLTPFILHADGDAGGNVREPNGGLGLVDVLPPCPPSTHDFELDVRHREEVVRFGGVGVFFD
jgi:hypothetical protein